MSKWAVFLTEAPPRVRWQLGRAAAVVHRRAFGSFGSGTVLVAPRKLAGVERIHLGVEVAIFDGAWLQCEAGGGPLEIGDRTYLGHDVHVHAIDPVRIGAECVLADGVFIASTDHDREVRSQVHGTGPINIGDRVFLGQRAMVLGGVSIGDGATVAAGAVVTRDVPAGAVVAGIPARVVTERGDVAEQAGEKL